MVPARAPIVQSPAAAFATFGRVAQVVLVQEPAVVQAVSVQVAVTVPVNLGLQTREQVVPLAISTVQSPAAALGTTGRDLQEVLVQTPVVVH